jgi:PhnB protein
MAVKAVPEGCTSVTPWIISQDTAGVIHYLKASAPVSRGSEPHPGR